MADTRTIITISRQYGSGGRYIGRKLAEALDIPFYDKEIILRSAEESGISREIFEQLEEKPTNSLLYSLGKLLFFQMLGHICPIKVNGIPFFQVREHDENSG